ncbi:MAG: DNA gyrase inhibitor YacG [Candidatus Rokubacteria bacterium]|nr:DNA gyrase inhibitor YacG [Candidatus Rokubacteria bacterium]
MSVADEADATAPGRGARCPTCQRESPWQGNPHRPFCSLTCRLVDLGVWLDEGYRVYSDPPEDGSPQDVP